MMRIKIKNITDRILSILLSALLLLQVYYPDRTMGAGGTHPDQLSCTQQLNQAEELYFNGEFDRVIGLVRECLQSSPTDETIMIRAYKILARTYLSRGDMISAEENIKLILKIDPSYQPTIEEETPKYVNLVVEIRNKIDPVKTVVTKATTDSTGISPWVWIGAGGAALVALMAIIASGNGTHTGDVPDQSALPEPPGYPQ
jgi:hypothetical protein